ncbi:hypothetical protein, partial [Streptococcus pneumoniae]|uniref:hypothetical protein n=1 Tax=Streptococcus pneumoniae TaxID=1313 RepID=UPI00214D1D58
LKNAWTTSRQVNFFWVANFNLKFGYIFLCLIVIETTGLLLLKRGLEMGYLDTEAIILAVFSFAFYNLCSFAWVCSTIKKQ